MFFIPPLIKLLLIGGGSYCAYKLFAEEPNQQIENFKDNDSYLADVLSTHAMSRVRSLVNAHREKRDIVRHFLYSQYPKEIHCIINSGSFAKSTGVNTKFDLDIIIAFKRSSFVTLKEMLETIYQQLRTEYQDKATIRKQTVSVGITFDEDENGDVVQIDIVPGRELNQQQYLDDKKLKLYIYSDTPKRSIQTNIYKQVEYIKGRHQERKIIRLLKIWKKYEGYPIKSFFLELATIKAFENNQETPNGLWEQLKMTMEYIRDNVTKDSFKLKDPGNSSNRVDNMLSSVEKEELSEKMGRMLKNIEEDANILAYYFPINKKFYKNN